MELISILISSITLFWLFLYTSLTYKELPKTIPIHFGISGKPDGYGNKIFYWLMPVIGLMISALMIAGLAETFNFSLSKIKIAANWKQELSNQIPFIINVIILLLFIDIQSSIYNVALQKTTKLNNSVWLWFILIIGLSILLPVFLKV